VLGQLIEGLAALHFAYGTDMFGHAYDGVSHCDIAPRNVMLTSGADPGLVFPNVKLIDLGNAEIMTDVHRNSDTPDTDVYALGAMMFQLIINDPAITPGGKPTNRHHEGKSPRHDELTRYILDWDAEDWVIIETVAWQTMAD